MKNSVYIILMFVLISCKKDNLPDLPLSNSPIFNVEGLINGTQFSVIAGEDGVVLDAQKKTINGVMNLEASLMNGQSGITFLLADAEVDIPMSTPLDLSSLNSLQLSGLPIEPLLILGKQHFSNADFIQHIQWIVNGEQETVAGPLIIREPGIYNICAQVTFVNQQFTELCQEMIIGYKKHASNNLKVLVSQNNALIAYFDTPENEIDRVEWYLNDSMISSEKHNLVHYLSGESEFTIKGKIFNTNGVVREKSVYYNILQPMNYIEDLTVFENQSTLEWDHRVRISIEHAGFNYASMHSTSEIIVHNCVPYEDPATGASYYKIHGNLTGPLLCIETEETVEVDLNFTIALPKTF
jgi:hypothetical protein